MLLLQYFVELWFVLYDFFFFNLLDYFVGQLKKKSLKTKFRQTLRTVSDVTVADKFVRRFENNERLTLYCQVFGHKYFIVLISFYLYSQEYDILDKHAVFTLAIVRAGLYGHNQCVGNLSDHLNRGSQSLECYELRPRSTDRSGP